ncbi:Serine/threonine-protein kinase plk1 [Mortierella sp. GBA35]|nr:Serine/threonine-protein kinase plk1 [Mortierella sp. GBA35]
MIDREIKMLERVKRGGGHDNIVTFLGTVDDIQGTGLLFELCNPRSFWTLLCARGALQEFEVRYFGRQLLEGLKHIHDLGLIHCDLKPDNVLIGNGMVLKIADFGLAEDSEEQENMLRGERTGTPGFNAPEVALMGKHTFALDIYSIGCIFYQMITGQLANLTTFIAAPPMPKDFFLKFTASCDAKDMLRQTLQYDVKERLKLPSLINHNFFREGYCPRMLPETVFDEQPSHAELEALDQQLQQKEEIAALEDYQNVNLKRQHDGIEIELEGDQTSSDEDGHSAKMKRQRKGKEVQRDQAERETETVEQDQVQLDVTKKKAKAVRRFKIKRRGVMEFLKDLEREEKKLKEMFGDDLNLQSSGDNGDNDDDDDA